MKKLCRTCRYWDSQHPQVRELPDLSRFGVLNPGLCRKHKPGADKVREGVFLGVQPVMDADASCAEHRIIEPDKE